jgi:two-component system response regulator
MTLGTPERPIEILVVEDNPADVELTQRALGNAPYDHNVTVAEDGEVAIAMLRKQGEHANVPRPDAIFLDLKMPNRDGWEVLKDINGDPGLKGIPVMLLTTLQAESTQLAESGIHPSRYCRKPPDRIRIKAFLESVIRTS